MKWLTREQVIKEALKGHKEALACSLKHWEQLLQASQKSLLCKARIESMLIYVSFCALCKRYYQGGCDERGEQKQSTNDCGKCPLRPKGQKQGCNNAGSPWWACRDAFDNLESFPSKENFAEWKKAAKNMRDRLKKELDKLNNKKKPVKVG